MADAKAKAKAAVDEKPETAAEGELKFVLRKEVDAHGDKIKEVTFREPTGGDIERHGNPISFDFSKEPPGIQIDEKKMTAMMVALSALPPSTFRAMHPRDWATCAWGIAGFFIPDIAM